MKRRVILSRTVFVGMFAIAAVLIPTVRNHKATNNTSKSSVAADISAAQTTKGIFSILGSVSPALTPTVTTGSATSIIFNSATLNATAHNVGTSPITSRGFEYGLTDGYGSTVDEVVPGSFDYVSEWGRAPNGDGQLYNPEGVALDSSGNLYVADTQNNRIQKFNSSGVYQLQFGSNGSGDGQFNRPAGIAVDSSGNIYVADTDNQRIQKFNSSGLYQLQFGSSGSGNGQFSSPRGVAIDSSGNMYVADTYNNRIQKFNSSGVYQSQFGGLGSGNGQFLQPRAIAIDSTDNIYAADYGNYRVQKFNTSGVYQSQFGSAGSGNGGFLYISAVTVDSSGNIYTADRYNNRTQKFNSSGVYQSQFGTAGAGDGQMNSPRGIAVDSTGNIYVSDTIDNRVQKFNSSGVYQSQFGNYDNGQLYEPRSIVANSNRDIYVVDTNNNRIQKFNSSGVYQSQFGSFGSGNGQFASPRGIAVDSSDNIYVVDSDNSRVQKFNSSGVYQSQFGSYGTGDGKFNGAVAVAVDSTGNIYVTDTNSHRVQKFNSSGVYQSQFGTQGSGNGQFEYPLGIAFDSVDNMYVSDLNHRVQKFNSSGVYQSQFGTAGAGNGQFDYPLGIAIDSNDSVYIADYGLNRVQKFDSSGVYQSQFGVGGSSGNGFFSHLDGITIDSAGYIYAVDTANHRVQKFIENFHEGDFSANITGLTCGTTYHYRAYANNSDGSAQGNDATFTTLACEPDPPTNLSATTASSSAIDLSWDAPVYEGDSAVSGYVVHYGKTGENTPLTLTLNGTNTSTTINGLDSSTEYEFVVVAVNSNAYLSIESGLVTATTDVYVSPSPDPPTNLQATINSATSITVSWDTPVNTGDSPIDYYIVYVQKVGHTGWSDASTNANQTSITLSGFEPSTQYNFKVVAINTNGNSSVDSDTITATTGTPGFYLINDCQQLQDIQNDLYGSYELARNIDCSDTVNWNGGAGFTPIGDIFNEAAFSGILAGNNYSISNLYINQGATYFGLAAPFAITRAALFQDIRIVHPVVSSLNNTIGIAAGLSGYDVTFDSAVSTSITNVHIVDALLQASGDQFTIAGGLLGIGSQQADGNASFSLNEFRGTIDLHGSMAGQVNAGGLVGSVDGGTWNISDSYADAAISVNNTFSGSSFASIAGGLVGGVGLIEGKATLANINHSYAAGSIAHNSAEPSSFVAIGGIAGGVLKQISIANSFAHTSITNSQPGVADYRGGILGGTLGPDSRTYSSNYFDASLAGTTDCASPLIDPIPCTAISGQPNYFYNNSSNAPLNTWDFTNIWNSTSTLPVFGKKVLTSITAIPASRLPGYVPPAGTVFPQASGAPTVGPVVPPKLSLRTFGDKFLPPVEEPTSLIEQLKKFLRNVPEVVLVTFPYAFFSLLLIAALGLLVEVWLQSKRLRATKLLIARQEAIAKERDTFWHLAANYLRAPITLMVGGIELLSDDKTPGIARLQTLSKQLQTKVGTIMARIEDSKSLQDIARPKVEAPRRVLGLLRFWVPIVAVAVLAMLMDYVATSYRNISLSFINLGVQLMLFVLVAMLFYWVLGALGVVSSKRKQAEALLARQTASLDHARSEFIAESATDLDNDLTQLQHELDGMHSKAGSVMAAAGTAAAMAIVTEGAHRLRDLIDSFQLLVAAQNGRLGDLSPQNAQTDLHSIVKGALAPLQPVISEKHLTVHASSMNNMVVPGNTLLLHQVIGSVLSNAVAFSPAGSTIELSLKAHKDSVLLSVTNQGKGISKDEVSHVFSPLTKADGYDGLQLDHDGLGVNLYIDKLIMQHLGGNISVASSTAQGTTMTMQWPTKMVG